MAGTRGGAAFAGTSTNTWNYNVIKDANLLVADKAGIAQTGAHEYFHTVQGNYVGLPESNFLWENVPSWVWEGSATFIGLQASSFVGFVDYLTLGKAYQFDRYRFGTLENKTLLLSEVTKNTATSDPYALGAAASEFLVSNIGMYNFIKIFKELKNKELPDAFFSATGIELEDFYQMFEEVRSTLGFPISL